MSSKNRKSLPQGSQVGQSHIARKLHVFDLMHRTYLSLIIGAALILVAFLYLGYRGLFNFNSLGVEVILLLIGYIVADQILPSFSQGVVVSMGFLFILLTLLVESPLVAWLVATLGSLVSDVLRNNFFLYRDRVPRPNRLWRSLFYAGLHSLAAMAAAIAHVWVSSAYKPFLGLQTVHVKAILAYIVTYGLVSQLLIWPHDWLINKLVMPDQVRFPRVTVLSALLVMTPIPVVLFYLYLQTPPTSQWLFLVISPLVFISLFSLMRSHVQVENERNRLMVVDFVHQEIKGTTSTMLDLTDQLMQTAFQLVRFDAIAIYGAEEKGGGVCFARSSKGALPNSRLRPGRPATFRRTCPRCTPMAAPDCAG